MKSSDKIFLAGHRGLVGSAILRTLEKKGFEDLVLRTRSELDLTDQKAVDKFFATQKPEYVILAAARVGGIHANNTYRADFIYENTMIQSNVIYAAYKYNVKKLLFLGSSCIYPKLASQPIHEESLLSGYLEHTNEPYAIAKISGIKMCDSFNRQYGTNFISLMPTNMYGPGDNFDLETSHVLPALMRKMHEAKLANESTVEVWGSGDPRREFLYSDDLGEACVYMMEHCSSRDIGELVNIGCGRDVTIRELAELIKSVVGYSGKLVFDRSKPDGTPQKLLDVSRAKKLGWAARTPLQQGIKKTYEWFCANQASTKK